MANRTIAVNFAELADEGTRPGQPTDAELLYALARNIQHCLAWGAVRIVGAQYERTPDATDRAVFYRWRIRDACPNSRALYGNISSLPRTSGSGAVPTWTLDGTSALAPHFSDAAVSPGDLKHWTKSKAMTPTLGDRELAVGTSNALRLQSAVVFQHLNPSVPGGWVLDDATWTLLDLSPYMADKEIYATHLQALIDRIQTDLWPTWRRQHFCWSVRGNDAGDAVARAAATYGNIFDQAVATYDVNTPGFTCPAYAAARFGLSPALVACDIEAYAQVTAGTGSVRFVSNGTTLGTVVSVGTTKQWYKVAQTFNLDAAAEADKVDVHIKADGIGDTIRVWAVRLQENPA